MTNPIPAGFQTRYFKLDTAAEQPTITREGNLLYIPCFINEEQNADGGAAFSYYRVPVPFRGQDYTNYDKCVLQSWSDLRHFFYGPTEAQNEMRDDHKWEAHRQCIRSAFPKYTGEVNLAVARFNAIKDEFWAIIDTVLASKGKTRDVLPSYFNDAYMLEWAAQNEVPADVIATAKDNLFRVSCNLQANDRNWEELFS